MCHVVIDMGNNVFVFTERCATLVASPGLLMDMYTLATRWSIF